MRRFYQAVSLALLASFGGMVAGCAQTGDWANEHRTATGAIAGTAVGAGAGALLDKDNRGRGALIGGALGAAVGTGVGYLLQKQKQSFDRIQDLEAQERTVIVQQAPPPSAPGAPPPPPVQVERQALTLRMQSDILFPVGSSALSPQGTGKVAEIAQVLREYPDSDVIVRGYTSSEGGDAMNFELSQRRAEVIKNQLISNGVAASRIQALGMGSSNPVASNDTEGGRIQNRRVEIDVIPRDQSGAPAGQYSAPPQGHYAPPPGQYPPPPAQYSPPPQTYPYQPLPPQQPQYR